MQKILDNHFIQDYNTFNSFLKNSGVFFFDSKKCNVAESFLEKHPP